MPSATPAEATPSQPLIGVVGPCGSGKSTLVAALLARGFRARPIAQEHSYVPAMWLRLAHPDVLIYLDARFETCTRRRRLTWTEAEYEEQLRRLAHSREHCSLLISTDGLTPEQVLAAALAGMGLEPPESAGV